jgi:Saxitoxin biosynthesis operon protein SxtJ
MNAILEEIKLIKGSSRDLRKFGLTVGPVLVVIGAFLLIKKSDGGFYWGAAGLVLIALAFVAPVALKPLNKVWMSIAILLGWVMTRLILIVLYYVAITPTGLIAKLLRKDILERKIGGPEKTYWQKREKKFSDAQSLERQF